MQQAERRPTAWRRRRRRGRRHTRRARTHTARTHTHTARTHTTRTHSALTPPPPPAPFTPPHPHLPPHSGTSRAGTTRGLRAPVLARGVGAPSPPPLFTPMLLSHTPVHGASPRLCSGDYHLASALRVEVRLSLTLLYDYDFTLLYYYSPRCEWRCPSSALLYSTTILYFTLLYYHYFTLLYGCTPGAGGGVQAAALARGGPLPNRPPRHALAGRVRGLRVHGADQARLAYHNPRSIDHLS